MDSLTKSQRDEIGVGRHELSEVLCGEEHAELSGMLQTVQDLAQDGIVANRQAETGRGDPLAKVSRGLREEQPEPTDDGDDGDGQEGDE